MYTPLHGVGWPYVQEAVSNATGLPSPIVVAEQAEADASFPTTPFPNPEEGQGVWDLVHATGAVHAKLSPYGVQWHEARGAMHAARRQWVRQRKRQSHDSIVVRIEGGRCHDTVPRACS